MAAAHRSLLTLLLIAATAVAADPPKSKWPIGKETTYVTGPLDKDGYIDYEPALNERLGKGVTPENNANVLIWKALGPRPEGGRMPPEYFKALGIDEPPEGGDYFIGLSAFVKHRLKLDDSAWESLQQEKAKATRRTWTAKECPRIADWLTINEKPLSVVIEATKRPAYFNPPFAARTPTGRGTLIGALMPTPQMCRELNVALAARAMFRLGEAKPDEAWQDLLACHRLARLVGRGATNIEALVGFALEGLACHADLGYLEGARLTSRESRDRLRELQALPALPPLADKMDLGERFLCLDGLQGVYREMAAELAASPPPNAPPGADPRKALDMVDWASPLRKANRTYDRLVAALREQDRVDRVREIEKIDKELGDDADKLMKAEAASDLGAVLTRMLRKPADTGKIVGQKIGDVTVCLMLPAVIKVQNAYDRTEQFRQITHVAFALAAYRRDAGKYPANLDELAPKYLATVPGDVFSGKPLVYRPTADGYLLYSVGVNGTDDGGRSFDDDPPGDDLTVRMPLPGLKRK